ncbi:MAG: hypothetical protein LBB61_05555 [Treponema sp.]|jgi:hypothetical protein|nr:hypothetical protein [Treponema sp.]
MIEIKGTVLLVFIPHRDCKKGVTLFKRSLFSSGFFGAFSFPIASPLAVLSRPLAKDELKRVAAQLRECTRADGRNAGKTGKITAGTWDAVTLGGLCFGGQLLAFPVERLFQAETAFPAGVVVERCAVPLLAEAVMRGDEPMGEGKKPHPARFSFTAGYAANLTLRPLRDDGYSFEWRIGEPAWLPKIPRGKTSRGPTAS